MNDYSNYFFVLNCHIGERDKLHIYSTFKELEVRDIIDYEGVVMRVIYQPPWAWLLWEIHIVKVKITSKIKFVYCTPKKPGTSVLVAGHAQS